MISGVDESLMDFITSESNERFITELTDDYFNELKAATEDYPDLSDTQIKVLEELEKKNIPFTTDIQTKRCVRMFKEFLDEKDLAVHSLKRYQMPCSAITYGCFILS